MVLCIAFSEHLVSSLFRGLIKDPWWVPLREHISFIVSASCWPDSKLNKPSSKQPRLHCAVQQYRDSSICPSPIPFRDESENAYQRESCLPFASWLCVPVADWCPRYTRGISVTSPLNFDLTNALVCPQTFCGGRWGQVDPAAAYALVENLPVERGNNITTSVFAPMLCTALFPANRIQLGVCNGVSDWFDPQAPD